MEKLTNLFKFGRQNLLQFRHDRIQVLSEDILRAVFAEVDQGSPSVGLHSREIIIVVHDEQEPSDDLKYGILDYYK